MYSYITQELPGLVSSNFNTNKVCKCMYVCVCICIYTCICVYVCAYMYVCIYTYIYICICNQYLSNWAGVALIDDSIFISRMRQLEQCVSPSLVFVYRKMDINGSSSNRNKWYFDFACNYTLMCSCMFIYIYACVLFIWLM